LPNCQHLLSRVSDETVSQLLLNVLLNDVVHNSRQSRVSKRFSSTRLDEDEEGFIGDKRRRRGPAQCTKEYRSHIIPGGAPPLCETKRVAPLHDTTEDDCKAVMPE